MPLTPELPPRIMPPRTMKVRLLRASCGVESKAKVRVGSNRPQKPLDTVVTKESLPERRQREITQLLWRGLTEDATLENKNSVWSCQSCPMLSSGSHPHTLPVLSEPVRYSQTRSATSNDNIVVLRQQLVSPLDEGRGGHRAARVGIDGTEEVQQGTSSQRKFRQRHFLPFDTLDAGWREEDSMARDERLRISSRHAHSALAGWPLIANVLVKKGSFEPCILADSGRFLCVTCHSPGRRWLRCIARSLRVKLNRP